MTAEQPRVGGLRRSGLYTFEVWTMYVGTILVGATGLAYAWLRYAATPSDPDAIVARPWQPLVQHVHVLAAPLLVFAVGAFWRTHVVLGFLQKEVPRRRTGWLLALTSVPMIVSGYLTQIAVDEAWRTGWGIVHTCASVLWLAGGFAHLFLRRK